MVLRSAANPRPRRLVSAAATLGMSVLAHGAGPHPEWTLYTPFTGTDTHLLDLDGSVVHTWASALQPAASVYLADDGAIIRTASEPGVFGGPGTGGRIERIAWDGTVEWSYLAASDVYNQHHDIEILPNGNVLILMWERFSAAEAIAMGRDPVNVGEEVWGEAIFEVEPVGLSEGNVVWEWHVWDHLVQDFDPLLLNYGAPSDHPGRIDINFGDMGSDWLHANGLDYNADLDQIVLSVRTFSEIWIISHDPKDSGDLRYRWGNPQAHGRGGPEDQRLFSQHDPEWIPDGISGAGTLTIYNNGNDRGYSSIDQLDTGVNPDGTYDLPADQPFGPADVKWTCDSIDGEQFYSGFMGGVQRLSNGNHLICISADGQFVEVDENCDTVWSYDAGTFVFRATRLDARDPRLEDLLWIAGDANGDFAVDVADLLLVLGQWGTAGPEGDLDGDGVVSVGDLLMLLAEWD